MPEKLSEFLNGIDSVIERHKQSHDLPTKGFINVEDLKVATTVHTSAIERVIEGGGALTDDLGIIQGHNGPRMDTLRDITQYTEFLRGLFNRVMVYGGNNSHPCRDNPYLRTLIYSPI